MIKPEATINQKEANKLLQCTHQNITFKGHILVGLNFNKLDLSGVYFAGIIIENTSFKYSICTSTSYYGSCLVNVDFTGCDLNNAIFKESTLLDCKFNKIKAPLWKKFYLWLKNR